MAETEGRAALWRSRIKRALGVLVAVSFAWLGLVFAFTNCSHTTPYVVSPSVEPARAEAAAMEGTRAPQLRLLLIGDAGLSVEGAELLRVAAEQARLPAEETVVTYLGDNIYPRGLTPTESEDYAIAAAFLQVQIAAFEGTGAEVIFVPGNHDWDDGGVEGRAALARQQAFIDVHGKGKARLAPRDGLPGPECRDHGGVRLVFIDTQWWLHEHDKPEADPSNVYARLRECLDVETHSVVMTHHPPQTHGAHGGYFDWQDHVFPLTRLSSWLYLPVPIIGSLYPIGRRINVHRQDLGNDVNDTMIAELRQTMAAHPPVVWAAGHEHNLQVLEGRGFEGFALVSGAGSRTSPVSHGDDTRYAHETLGFMELLFLDSQRVFLRVHALYDDEFRVSYETWLRD